MNNVQSLPTNGSTSKRIAKSMAAAFADAFTAKTLAEWVARGYDVIGCNPDQNSKELSYFLCQLGMEVLPDWIAAKTKAERAGIIEAFVTSTTPEAESLLKSVVQYGKLLFGCLESEDYSLLDQIPYIEDLNAFINFAKAYSDYEDAWKHEMREQEKAACQV